MSAERIDLLFSALGCSNSEIARRSGYSASYISRLRSGARRPGRKSASVRRLAEELYKFAGETGNLAALRKMCGAGEKDGADSAEALFGWLCGEGKTEGRQLSPSLRKTSVAVHKRENHYFAERLNMVMNVLSLSNVMLARQVNVDPSYICRLRSGERSLKADGYLARLLAKTLLDASVRRERVKSLSELCGVEEEKLAGGGTRLFSSWLVGGGGAAVPGMFDAMLDSIESFSPVPKTDAPSFSEIAHSDILNKREVVYVGVSGLREAVVRFLGNAALGGGELWLYSDEEMEWMTGDKGYFPKWYALMLECVKRGVRIKIIHNIDRGEEEMVSAIQSWLPLYMSGMIEPFVCRRKRDDRFAHTLFLRPGSECLFSLHVKGADGIYDYCTEGRKLSAFASEYKTLLSLSRPLVKVNTERAGSFSDPCGALRELSGSLPLAVMPEALLKGMLRRNKVPRKRTEAIIEFYRMLSADLRNALSVEERYYFAPLAERAELADGKTEVDVPPWLLDGEICYESDEYVEHVRAMIDMLINCPSYHFHAIDGASLKYVRIRKHDEKVIVSRMKKPYAEFTFTEPLMLLAFDEYFDLLKKQHSVKRNVLLRKLRGYF